MLSDRGSFVENVILVILVTSSATDQLRRVFQCRRVWKSARRLNGLIENLGNEEQVGSFEWRGGGRKNRWLSDVKDDIESNIMPYFLFGFAIHPATESLRRREKF